MSRDHLGVLSLTSDLQFAKGVLLLDDCEGTYRWNNTGTGADFVGDFNAVASFVGSNGFRLQTRATDPAENDNVRAQRSIQFPETGLFVWRGMFSPVDAALIKAFTWWIRAYDGTDIYDALIQWDVGTPRILLNNEAGAQKVVPGLDFGVSGSTYIQVELVLDLLAMEYVTFTFGGVKVDCSEWGMQDTGNSSERKLTVNYMMTAAGAAQATSYVDQIYCGEFVNV